MRVGKMIVQKRVSRSGAVPVIWECLCDCGTVVNRNSQSLRNGRTYSCGCQKRKRGSKPRASFDKTSVIIYSGRMETVEGWCLLLDLDVETVLGDLRSGKSMYEAFHGKSPYQIRE